MTKAWLLIYFCVKFFCRIRRFFNPADPRRCYLRKPEQMIYQGSSIVLLENLLIVYFLLSYSSMQTECLIANFHTMTEGFLSA